MEEFPLDFWGRRNVSPIEVLGEILNEIRQPTKAIIGYSEVLLTADLLDQQRTDIKTILEQAKYLETILNAGRKYYMRTMNEEK